MGRRRRLRKSDGGELEINRQDLAASDEVILLPSVDVSNEAILFPYVVASDAGGAQQNVTTSDAGGAQQNVTTSDAGGAQQNVTTSDAGGAQQNVTTSYAGGAQQNVTKHNIATSNEAADDQSVVALDQEIGEHNGSLSQLKHKDNIVIDCFRIRGHQKIGHQINYRLIKLYKFLEV